MGVTRTHEQSGLLLDLQYAGEEQVEAYRACLTRLVDDPLQRARFSEFALTEASHRSWYDAMECSVSGYREVIEQKAQSVIGA